MVTNYVKIALRNMRRHKFYAGLNILGLACGLTSAFLIGLYIYDEATFDKFHKDHQDIYCIGLHIKIGGQEFKIETSPPPLANAMVTGIPGVYQAIHVNDRRNTVVRYDDKAFTESKVFLADSNFFTFFSFKLLEGNPKTVLKDPYTIVLTKRTAVKYFGEQSVIGKTILLGDDKQPYKITGVADQPPANSHLLFDMVFSSSSDKNLQHGSWNTDAQVYTYYKKNTKTSVESVERSLRAFVLQHIAPGLEGGLGENFASFEKKGGIYKFFTYSLVSSHLHHPEILDDGVSNIKYVYMIGAVGLFILLIACINFMNLSTARSASRAKEVGLRKTMGSARSKLISQFLSESFVYVFAATALSLIALYLLLPGFNLLAGKSLVFSTMLQRSVIAGVLMIIVVVALLAGSYPAFYLTSFNPIEVLKGNVRTGMKSKGIRSVLVVVQFTISITLIICTLVVHDQLGYMQKKNMGLDKQNVLILENTKRLRNNQQVFYDAVTHQSGIVQASYTDNVFPNSAETYHVAGNARDIILITHYTDEHYADVLKMQLAQGRYFSNQFPSDSMACIINEAAAKEFGWTDALDQKITLYKRTGDLKVIGVVRNFNFESFKSKVKPLIIRMSKDPDNLLIRYAGDPSDAVAIIEALWKKNAANEPFEYSFLDKNFDKLFGEEQRLGKLVTVMTGIAIVVACLGLLGLASFIAEQRTKEIGIRKVLGASVASINSLLSKEFMILVAISFAVASALAWYLMSDWLDTFAYRIDLSVIVFLVGGAAAAATAWLTVSYHFIKAARSNPTDALRWE